MIPERPVPFGASTNPTRHAELATPEAVLARVRAMTLSPSSIEALARNEGTVLRAHLFDAFAARAWIAEAARGTGEGIDGLLAGDPDAQRAEVVRVWQAFANFWRALNVNPFAWMPLRHALEDAWGHPRCDEERGPVVSPAENALHRRGVTWRFQEVLADFGAETEYRTTTDDPGMPPGASSSVPWEGWFRARLRAGYHRVTGRDLGPRRVLWGWMRRRLGEGGGGLSLHRLRLTWSSTMPASVYVHPVMSAPAAEWDRGTRDPLGETWQLNVPGAATSWNDDFRAIIDDDGIVYALPASRWYFDLLRAPIPGLKLRSGGSDVSLVDYLAARGPEEVIREVMRDVMALNLAAMEANRLRTEMDLFGAALEREDSRNQRTAEDNLAEVQNDRNTASAVLGAATGIATAISPVAGVVVGAAGLIARLSLLTIRPAVDNTTFVDVFERPMPTFEQFESATSRSTLEGWMRAVGLPEGARDPDIDRVAREAAAIERARTLETVRAAVLNADPAHVLSQRAAGRRTVVLTGLDPARGARVFIGDREYTTGLPELGRAGWIDADGVPAWRFGVPESASSIRVVYPDDTERVVSLPAVEPMLYSDWSPETRTAVVDATQPASPSPGAQGAAMGYPSRAVVLVGLAPNRAPQLSAGGVDVSQMPAPTGDAPRWIDSTLVPNVPGYLFGVPAGAREVVAVDDLGVRSFPLPEMRLTAPDRDRVTVIDARRPAPPPSTMGTVGRVGAVALGAVALGFLFKRWSE